MTTKNNKLFIFGFILPVLLTLIIVYAYPVIRTIGMSFFNMKSIAAPISEWEWVGFDNYIRLSKNQDFLTSVTNMLKLCVWGGLITIVLSTIFGVLVSAKSTMPGRHFFRTVIYMPNMLSAIAIGSAFTWYFFQEQYGFMTSLCNLIGLQPIRWMTGENRFWSMMFAIMFCGTGYYMLLMTAGIESIPDDLYEAAVIDGAGPLKKFWYITLPLLKGTMRTMITFYIIGALQSFAWNKAFSPVDIDLYTISPITFMYEALFGTNFAAMRAGFGLGAAVGVFTAALSQALYLLFSWLLRSDDLQF